VSAEGPGGDAIRITGMRFWGKHGANPGERERDQPIDVDLEVTVDASSAASSDALADTIDYAELYRTCERIVTQQSFALLEALAGRIARACLRDARIGEVTVRVRKPRLLDGATPEIQVRRRRADG
jgi:7,8-dihydroneopterin aldolase/epimerase/oxygenase